MNILIIYIYFKINTSHNLNNKYVNSAKKMKNYVNLSITQNRRIMQCFKTSKTKKKYFKFERLFDNFQLCKRNRGKGRMGE